MPDRSTFFNLMLFTPLLLGPHEPMSACSFLYEASEMDSNTWKKTSGVRKLINLNS